MHIYVPTPEKKSETQLNELQKLLLGIYVYMTNTWTYCWLMNTA